MIYVAGRQHEPSVIMLMFGDFWNRDVDSKRIKDDVYT